MCSFPGGLSTPSVCECSMMAGGNSIICAAHVIAVITSSTYITNYRSLHHPGLPMEVHSLHAARGPDRGVVEAGCGMGARGPPSVCPCVCVRAGTLTPPLSPTHKSFSLLVTRAVSFCSVSCNAATCTMAQINHSVYIDDR